ncbi:MAG: hypothetical protein ACFB6R_04245 [Alphaproteobacteria bacterium]
MSVLTKADIDHALEAYDGTQVRTLRAVVSIVTPPAEVMAHIISRCREQDPRIQSGASWLIKTFLEAGTRLTVPQIHALVATYAATECWDACLHHCQSLRWIDVPEDALPTVGDFLGRCLSGPEPSVRAWACDALFQVTRSDPGLLANTAAILQDAEHDPAPSVRARAKALLKACRAGSPRP